MLAFRCCFAPEAGVIPDSRLLTVLVIIIALNRRLAVASSSFRLVIRLFLSFPSEGMPRRVKLVPGLVAVKTVTRQIPVAPVAHTVIA